MREETELNYQEPFISSLLYLQPPNAQVLSHLPLLTHSPTEVEGDTDMMDGGQVWQQKIVRQNCLSQNATSVKE